MTGDLKSKVVAKCHDMDVDIIGFASADAWEHPPFEPWPPEAFQPKAIFPGCRTVIVLGLPVTLPILETAPSIWYRSYTRTSMPSWTNGLINCPSS